MNRLGPANDQEIPPGSEGFLIRVRASRPWMERHRACRLASGGPQDGTITFVKRKGDRIYCGLHFFVEDAWTVAGSQLGERARCATRLNKIKPTKRIRWWIRSPVVGVGGPIDRAPDSGWYD